MKIAMDETTRRRALQVKYNEEHGITPETLRRRFARRIESEVKARRTVAGSDPRQR